MYCSVPCSALGRRADAEARFENTCIECGKPITTKRKPSGYLNTKRQLCSTECRSKYRGRLATERFNAGEIGRHIKRNGYVWISIPAGASRTGKKREMLEHRYVMEQMLGRPLRDGETVHHMNGQKTDNRPENLSLRSGNHGPGGDVSAMVKWAHDFIALYPQFDREGHFTPVDGGVEIHHPNPASRT